MRYRNQRELLDEEKIKNTTFLVIGAGAIGSFLTMTLAKMGAKGITVFDGDSVEEHNFANQMYPDSAKDKPKVDALRDVVISFGDCIISSRHEHWHPDKAISADIVVSAVDNMDARKAIWDYYKNSGIQLFVDGRMAAQVYRVYGIDPKNAESVKFYENSLYPQSEADPERCGQKSIIYTVLGVASEMLSQIKRFLMNEYRPTEVIYDYLNNSMTSKFHMEPKYEKIEAPDTGSYETAVATGS